MIRLNTRNVQYFIYREGYFSQIAVLSDKDRYGILVKNYRIVENT